VSKTTPTVRIELVLVELERSFSPGGANFAIYIAQRELVRTILSRRHADGGQHLFFWGDGSKKVAKAHDDHLRLAAAIDNEPLALSSRPSHNLAKLRPRRQRADNLWHGIGRSSHELIN
jgi:hypothetical protein